MFFIKQSLSRQ